MPGFSKDITFQQFLQALEERSLEDVQDSQADKLRKMTNNLVDVLDRNNNEDFRNQFKALYASTT